jgi:DNA-binding CsgD family transcriptional regulator
MGHVVRLPAMETEDQQNDQVLIRRTIAEECEAFYLRDYDGWAAFWLHNEDIQRCATDASGNIVVQRGWHYQEAMMKQVMADHPEPNQLACEQIRRENMIVHVMGGMAWATFDQFTPRTEDVMVNIGLSHQIRVFEKLGGNWKIVVAGHADTRTKYLIGPSIQVDEQGKIIWKNESARAALRGHPILTESAGILRAKHGPDDKVFREKIAKVWAMTPMDVRPTSQGLNNSHRRPLVFEEPTSTTFHLIWVTLMDGLVLVFFDNDVTREVRLAAAQSIYGLSGAQMRLAALIVDGNDLPTAAEVLGVSINTARTHLARMFDKVHVNSQTALVRTLLSADAPVA